MDTVQLLIQQVVRGFYDVKAVIIMDALLHHRVLSDKELISMLGLPAKEIRSICARLKEDHLLKDVSHKDDASRDQRTFSQTYYYIHFTEAIDAVKWKMYSIESKLKEQMDAQHNPHDYICDVCKNRVSTIDAVSLFDPEMGAFLCNVCANPLREDDRPDPQDGNSAQDQKGELMQQLHPLITALRKIDDMVIPENTFQSEMQVAIPVPTAEHLAEAKPSIHTSGPSQRLPEPAQATFEVHITSDAERAAQERESALEKKRLLEENALPQWHVQSTVGQRVYDQTAAQKDSGTTVKTELTGDEPQEKKEEEDAMEAYYRKLAEQQAENGQDEEDEEEDEDEFEDVL